MKKQVVVDTNILLDNPYIIEETDYKFLIPQIVLQELDGLKRNDNVGYNARLAIKNIYHNLDKENIEIVTTPVKENNDDEILKVAKNTNSVLLSNDIALLVKAHQKNVPIELRDNLKNYDRNFKGYYKVYVDTQFYFATFNSTNEFQFAEIEERIIRVEGIENIEDFEVPINTYLIVMPNEGEGTSQIVRKTLKGYEKIDTSIKLVKGLGIKGRLEFDDEVFMYLDALLNDTAMTAVRGEIGSGKTMIALLGGLLQTVGRKKSQKFEKIIVTRPPVPIDKSLEIGFLKGDLEQKMGHWLYGVRDNLEYLYQDEVEAKKVFEEKFRIISLETVQGASFQNAYVIIDEAQFLNEDMLKQIMSRVASTSKLVLLFDPKQNYGIFRGREGYKKLLPFCKGNKLISFIHLEKVRRSPLTELAMKIFD